MSTIKVSNLKVRFQTKNNGIITAIEDGNATFKHGEISVILGPSGCGKTTLLKCLIDSLLYEGNITLNDVDIEKISVQQRNLSYVSQEFSLYPHMTVFENISFPLKLNGVHGDEIRRRVNEIATLLGIDNLYNRLPKVLSIGQRQRVALARAFIKKSDVYLFDEPFSNLDKEKQEEIKPMLKKILKSYNATAIFVTHETKDIFLLADRVFVMDEGKFVFEGTPQDVIDNTNEALYPYFNIEDLDSWKR